MPTRQPSHRYAIPSNQLSEIWTVAATTGNDPDLDALILRLHIETACRRGGALALRPHDLDPDQCLVYLRTYTAFGVHRGYRWVLTALGQRRAGPMSSARWSWLAHQRR
ncbi:hypothetical protein [Nocardia gipuzkoensis]